MNAIVIDRLCDYFTHLEQIHALERDLRMIYAQAAERNIDLEETEESMLRCILAGKKAYVDAVDRDKQLAAGIEEYRDICKYFDAGDLRLIHGLRKFYHEPYEIGYINAITYTVSEFEPEDKFTIKVGKHHREIVILDRGYKIRNI